MKIRGNLIKLIIVGAALLGGGNLMCENHEALESRIREQQKIGRISNQGNQTTQKQQTVQNPFYYSVRQIYERVVKDYFGEGDEKSRGDKDK